MSGDASEAQRGQHSAPKASGDVFISYASQDKAVAAAVCKALESAGVACWIAPRNVTPGEFYAESIVHAIDSAKVAVLVLSQHTANSQHVLREVERVSSKRHPIVTLRTDVAPLPGGLEYFLNTSQWLDASATGVYRALPKLVDAVRSALAQSPAVARVDPGRSTTTRVSQPWRRNFIALAAIIVVALGYVMVDRIWLSKHVDEQQASVVVTPASPADTILALAISDKSIAVLPFIDMSEKKDQEYFADGISEELLNLLAKIPELQVISRSSAFSFKGHDLKAPDIAKRLNVAHILEGSVRKAGNQVRISVQLIEARSDTHLWSETYDRTLDDIFAIQDEIAATVVGQLKVKLLSDAPKVGEIKPEAYALYLQARSLGHRFTAESLEHSNTLYEQVLAIDPKYAAAWAGLARNKSSGAFVGTGPSKDYLLAREMAQKALSIDPSHAPAHATLGQIAMEYDHDLAATARHVERALALEPSNLDVISAAGVLLASLGRLESAIELQEYVTARDPVNPIGYDNLAYSYRSRGRWDEAIASYRTVLQLSPAYISGHYWIGVTLMQKGDAPAALDAIRQEPSEVYRLLGLVMVHHALGDAAESDAALTKLMYKYGQAGWAFNIAYALAYRDEADRVFEWLNNAVRQGEIGLSWINTQNLFANVHDDPRWRPFLESTGKSPKQLDAIQFKVTRPGSSRRSAG
jgi:TolB-like protein